MKLAKSRLNMVTTTRHSAALVDVGTMTVADVEHIISALEDAGLCELAAARKATHTDWDKKQEFIRSGETKMRLRRELKEKINVRKR